MQKSNIRLPSEDFIDLWDFTRLIAKAICPSLREIEDHSWLQQKLVRLPGSAFDTQFEMTVEERDSLVRLVPGLPARAGMSKGDRDVFMETYVKHPDSFPWVPKLVTDEEVTANGFKILQIQEKHLLALQRKIASGEIIALDENHITETRIGKNIFVRREDAIRYLEQQHLQVSEDQSVQTVPHSPKRATNSKRNSAPEPIPRMAEPNKIVAGDANLAQTIELKATPTTGRVAETFVKPKAADRRTSAHIPAGIKSAEDNEPLDTHSAKAPLVILRRKQVETRTGLSRSTIYDKLDPNSPRHDPSFPKQIKLSSSSSGWLESEIDDWLTGRMNARRS
ncbi:AlpA family transcriptional regulator [Variovorax sp. OV700]|uniref:helix-turn-helix transcriptional regulator n=1 Tax=Variovorax sp. OV700 TaxID=1882826 RepID=UPI000885F384|nr:AlpA family phage regulatory protein [Variovorax sp. OV700]SDH55884.1 transcriptional regulator, AlpA family [Variovorax sp. OV700]